MRLTLAMVMTVAQLAGPWLCCCGPGATIAVSRKSDAPPASQPDTGCPHCKKDAPACPPTDDAPKKPHAPDHRCPCGGVLAATVPADKPSVPTLDTLLVGVSVEPPLPISSVIVATPAVVGLREVPHLTAADRLYAHHVLRC